MNGDNVPLRLSRVYFVPDLLCNLLSASRLDEAGCNIEITNKRVIIYHSGKVIATGLCVNGLYRIKFEYVNTILLTNTEATSLWHRRLAHPSNNVLKNMLKTKNLSKFAKGDELCVSCVEAKQARLPFSNHFTSRSKRILELVHSDVCGPISPSTINDSRYIVTFIDDFTHYARIYLTDTKSDVLNCFKLYEAFATALTGERIAYLRCDNGGEYKSTAFAAFTNEKGITVQYTAPYTSQQNGVAERFNRSLVEKLCAVLYDSKLEKSFWGEAALFVTYTINRTCTTTLPDQTPAETFLKQKQNYNKLRVFGCIAHNHIPDDIRSKLEKKIRSHCFCRIWSKRISVMETGHQINRNFKGCNI